MVTTVNPMATEDQHQCWSNWYQPSYDGKTGYGSHGRVANSTSRLNNNDQGFEADFLSANSHTKESSMVSSRAEVNGANVSRKIIGELSEGSHNVHYGSDNIETNFGGSKTVAPSPSLPVATEEITTTAILQAPSPYPSLPVATEDMIDTVPEHREEEATDDPSHPPLSPKSKRSKVVPGEHVQEIESGDDTLARAREADPFFTAYSCPDLVMSKYTKLVGKLSNNFVINVAGLAVTSKDITGIVELSRSLPARHYPKFERSRSQESYNFPKDLVHYLGQDEPTMAPFTHHYFPFDLGNKDWVVVCFDLKAWKLTVLECNMGLRSDEELAKQLQPFRDMIPPLLRRTGVLSTTASYPAVVIERPNVVRHNSNRSHSALTSILLMQTHARFGIEICRSITPTTLKEEAQRLVVMLYELHEKL
ncbi:Uncharacterized protein Rs2_44533 [Raphanus sativus]|nr:Uncharacterized protein Rs2_44533 [Raphanus sativus]